MVQAISESDSELCQLDVYEAFDDIDNRIEIYEKRYQKKIADGDSGALTKLVLDGLREEGDQKK